MTFPEVKKKLGFGFMRLPMKNGKIDTIETNKMVDCFIENGFNYFDTARGYMAGKSEWAIRECLTSRYPREAYVLTDKLSDECFSRQEDIRPLFEKQLRDCGVDYFDFYLMHAMDTRLYKKYQQCKAFETAYEFKKEGRIRHFGISFHDQAHLLDQILTDHPEVEAVQIQFNYVDFDDPAVESRKCSEVCKIHGKPVMVMEPIKGGNLVRLPAEADKILRETGPGSNASYAIRFAASPDHHFMVLSGMSSMKDMVDNIGYMKNFKPLNEKELQGIQNVIQVFRSRDFIPCTACGYCLKHCPVGLPISDFFSLLNTQKQFNTWNTGYYYRMLTMKHPRASDCIKCGRCEDSCPQHLKIRKLLKQVSREFE